MTGQITYTTVEAAPLLGLSDRSIRRRIDRGLIKATTEMGPGGSRSMIAQEEIDRYKRAYPHDKGRRGWSLEQMEPVAVEDDDSERLDLIERTDDKKIGHFNWREANKLISSMQEFHREASWSQDTLHVAFPEAEKPFYVLPICDSHIGDWTTDHALLERITDEVLSAPDVYLMLLGDLTQLAIKMRSVAEVSSNMLPPEMQMHYLESWLEEIKHRVLCATWSNHEAEREEKQSGISMYKNLLSRRVPYFSGIGHVDIQVGEETYSVAVSHLFRGRTMYNPVHGAQRYMRMEAPDREIACAGDSHVPGFLKYSEGGRLRLAINGGSMQSSSYAKRYFSLLSHPHFPGFTLSPHSHTFTPYWSYSEYKEAQS